MNRGHLIYRDYVAITRFEQHTPEEYTDEIRELEAIMHANIVQTVTWEESVPIAKVIYEMWGLTSRQQFALGIVEQPGHIANLIICSELRNKHGDISGTPGFDKHGNFICDRHNEFLVTIREKGVIVGLKGFSTRRLKARAKTAGSRDNPRK